LTPIIYVGIGAPHSFQAASGHQHSAFRQAIIRFIDDACPVAPTLALIAVTTAANGLEDVMLKRSISIFLTVLFSFL
jgi:hypothetical protein